MARYTHKAILWLLAASLLFLVGWLFGRNYGRRITDSQIRVIIGAKGGKLSRVINHIEHDYVDSISSDSLAELAIPAILHKLDPHSVYIPAREFREMEEPLQGEFDGIGNVVSIADVMNPWNMSVPNSFNTMFTKTIVKHSRTL